MPDVPQTTEDFILRVPRVDGRSRDQLFTQIALFIQAAHRSAITGAAFSGQWPEHPWGSPIDYILLRDQTP